MFCSFMEDSSIEDIMGVLKNLGSQDGIEFFEIATEIADELPNVCLGDTIEEKIVKTKEEALSEVNRFMRLAEKLKANVIFYKLDTRDYKGKKGYCLDLSVIHNGINFKSNITSSSYREINVVIVEDIINEMEENINKVREALESVFKTQNFDPYQLVTDSFLPYLEKKGINYQDEFFDDNGALKIWMEEILGIDDFEDLIDELVSYYIEDDKNNNIEGYGSSILTQLEGLIPYMYEETYNKDRVEMTTKIRNFSIAIYKKTKEVAMLNLDAEYVKEITDSYLKYRKHLGIRSPNCTKEEIDAYLRKVRFDSRVPQEMLKNAMYDIANSKKN